ncbi:hypothetical protein Bca52824_091815 [Brassica carinata]|uniref:Uncharacterized protein n=1 Tax=Brassica carinata TaxID=52824 RepID=A0A8X7TF52_BRACI|nr:hypothetical protein Bca52824_091815 [Brassica carinata]
MYLTGANTCTEGLGTCENCDERCKAKHGPSSESNCDRSLVIPLSCATINVQIPTDSDSTQDLQWWSWFM